MENTFTVGQKVRSIWLGDEGVVTGDDDGMIVVMYGKNRVLHFANEIEAIAPVNNGAASLKVFDEPDSLTDLGAIDLQAELETLRAKFDTVETLLHEVNLELERVKAERDAAVKALGEIEAMPIEVLSVGTSMTTNEVFRAMTEGGKRIEMKAIARNALKEQSND